MSTENNIGENIDSTTKQTDEASGGTEENDVPTSPSASKLKVDVLLKPAGDAPIMTKRKWAVERTKTVSYISDFVKRFIKMTPGESIFLYVNQSFAPAPDASVGTVFDCFGSDGKLVLHYCRTQAWG